MRIAIAGKGGSGKTTVAAVIARTLARQGAPVIALDCDSNPNLGISLGLGPARTLELAAIRQALEADGVEHAPDPELVLARFGQDAPDGVRLAVVTQIDTPNPG
jgi:CO dehydrogenase maturation factor